ncbi:hypothetical protein [Odoribacter laneus]|uniref:hypothetical protein n=1 Tax=Odoribacter laneus TaxID=626933 RepID=UPI003AF88E34
MRVYLDFNIYASIEAGEFTIESVLEKLNTQEVVNVFYSAAHIYETDNITAPCEEIRKVRILKRLDTIKMITNNMYLFHELPSNNVRLLNENPIEVYNTITKSIDVKSVFNSFMNIVSNDQKIELRRMLGIDARFINNYRPEDVVGHLNTKISGWGISFVEMIEHGITLHPDGKSFGLHNRIAGIFELLDMFGYWTDKYTYKSNVARLWDFNHCYFASFCDDFISNDKRTRNKAKVVYNLYDIATKVMSSAGDE